MNFIGTAHIAQVGKHIGFYDVFEVDTGTYFAHPKNKWESKYHPTEWDEFYFSKQKHWQAEPPEWKETAVEIVKQMGLKGS